MEVATNVVKAETPRMRFLLESSMLEFGCVKLGGIIEGGGEDVHIAQEYENG